MEMWFVFVAGGLFILAIMVYVLFMVFLPEWVGITGKKALEAEQSHIGDETLERMEQIQKKAEGSGNES